MLTYNTRLKKLILPEYGRNIQQMVDHCLTIENRDERTACAYAIIKAMGNLFPAKRNDPEAMRAMWDHLAIMADFNLDIDWPYEPADREALSQSPEPLHHAVGEIRQRHYGRLLLTLVEHASEMEPGEERDALILLIANQMKKALLAVNPDGVDDAKVFDDLAHLSHGRIRLSVDTHRLHQFEEAPKPTSKKKKKK